MSEDLKDWGANLVEIFPPISCANPEVSPQAKGLTPSLDAVLWPSKYLKRCIDRNDLALLCDAFHSAGMKVMVTHGQRPYWCGFVSDPRENASDYKTRYEWHVERWAGIITEELESGVDYPSLMMDEEERSGRRPASFSMLPDKEAFEKKFHVSVDSMKGDSPEYRRWKLAIYESSAQFLKDVIEQVKARRSGPFNATALRFDPLETNNDKRPDYNLAFDIIGHNSGVSAIGTDPYLNMGSPIQMGHYYCPATTKHLVAAEPWSRPCVTMNPPPPEKKALEMFPPPCVYGSAISSAMHGGGGIIYWRYNLFRDEDRHEYWKHIKTAFSMLDTLAAWDAGNAKIPPQIVVLKSRASEDWWYTHKSSSLLSIIGGERSRGFSSERAVMLSLLSNGYPFRVFYLDHPEDYAKLPGCKLLIIPFAYSISDDAVRNLERLTASGTRILVMEKSGETDEFGDPRPQPALKALADKGQANLLDGKLLKNGATQEGQAEFLHHVDTVLGSEKKFSLNHYGKDIEAAMLEKGIEKILMLTNWTNGSVPADIGLGFPPGTYTVLKRSPDSLKLQSFSGKEWATEQDLANCRFQLAPYETILLRIIPRKSE